MNEGLEIEVYHFSDPLTKVTTLNNAKKHKALEELKSTGGGSFEIAIDDPKIVANPGLLAGRNIYKLRVDGTVVSAFIRDKRKKHMVTPGENGDTRYEISGPGLKAWFDDAEVRPRGGLKARSQNDRHFNFATEQGAWYNSANWVDPTIIGTILVSPYDKTRPEKWPENTPAQWIWGSPHTMPTMPLGNCYFRYEITTATDERYVLYTAADDNFTLYIDGEKKVETDPDATALSETVRTEFFMPAGNHVIAYRAANGTLDGVTPRGPAAFVAALFVLNGEQENLVTKTGDAGWKVNAYPATEPGWTAGEVLLKLMAEAESRGVLFPTWLTPTFTATHDSRGLPWTDKLPWSFKVGDSLLNVINQMEELIGDIWIDPDTYELNFVPKRGNDFSFTEVYEDLSVREAITFRKGYNLLDATIEGRSKLKNALSVKTDLGWMNVEDEGTSISTYGRLEGTLKIGAPRAVSEALADVVISQRKTEEEGATYEIAPTTREMPFVEFNVGDYVAAPNELNEPVSRRVLSISVEQDSNGRPKYSIEFDVIFRENEDRLNKIINKIGAGGVGGDFSGVTNPDTGFGDPVVIPPPAVPPIKFPLPPSGVSVTSAGNWTTNGVTAYSEVTVDWDPVTSNTDGSLTTPEYYEVWGKAVGADGDPFEQFARVTGTIATIQPFAPGVEYQYYVIARNPSGEASAQSTLVSHTPVGPTTPLAAPSTPTVTSDKGNLIITWDGLLGGMSPLPQFRYVYAKVATTAGGTYTQRGQTLGRGGGNIVVSGLTVGQTYHVKLVAVDGAGIASPDSLSASTTLTGISLGSLESDVAAAIQAAQDAADAAQIDADAAAIAAGDALTAANTAQTTANGKNTVWYQTTAPTGTAHRVGDLWFDTDDGNRIYSWTGAAWASQQLGTNALGNDAITAAKIADGTITATELSTAVNTSISNAQATADNKNTVWYQTTAPSGTAHAVDDIWFDTDDGNRIYRWSGSAWVAAQFGTNAIAALAITDALIANGTISNAKIANLDAGKITTGTLSADRIGANSITANKLRIADLQNLALDLQSVTERTAYPVSSPFAYTNDGLIAPGGTAAPWFITLGPHANGYASARVGENFRVVPGEKIFMSFTVRRLDANSSVGLNIQILDATGANIAYDLRPATAPSGLTAGVWTTYSGQVTIPANGYYAVPTWKVLSATGQTGTWYLANPIIRRTATGELIVDGSITAAKMVAGTITAASGIIADAAITNAKIADGTIQNAKIADATIQNAKIANLDAAKITTGTLDANRIGARTISAEKLVIGDFENRLNNPSFEFSSVGWTLTAQASIVTITDPPAGGNKALQVVANGTIIDINSEYMSVTPGDKWYAEVWVRKVSGTDTLGNVQLGATIVGDNGFTAQYPVFSSYSIEGLADGAWDKISGIVTIPANAARMLIRMSVRNDVADGTYQFDGAALRRMNTGEVIVDGSITTQKLAAESVTATVIAADSIAAYHIQANTITAAEIASETITGEEILARSISADRMELGTLTVNELHPSVGSQLNISANEAVNILVGQITGVESNLDSVSDDLDVMQTYYQFGAEGATISSPGSIYQVALRSDRIQMLQGGVEVSYWNAGQLHVNSFIGETVILSNHQIAKYGNDTVVRKA